jgi:hypothetical protein
MSDNQPIETMRARHSAFPEVAGHDELMSALEAAKTGHDPESARSLMVEMLRQLQAGSRIVTPYVENWIIHAFGKILSEGCTADQAFGLKAERGKHERPDTHDRDIVATAMVILAMRSGKNWSEGIGEAANLLFEDGTGDKAVQAAYSKYHEALDLLTSSNLSALLPK